MSGDKSARPVRIIVADDHHVVRNGFAALLETQSDFTVVGTASDGAEAVRACRALSPDVVLMDVRMPVMDGIEATRQLRAGFERDGPQAASSGRDGTSNARGESGSDGSRDPSRSHGVGGADNQRGSAGPRVLILTTFELDEYVYDALRAGASGFLLKDATSARLFDAVRVVAAGDALLAPSVTRRLIAEFARQRPGPGSGAAAVASSLAALTPRETQVLRLVAEGLSNPEIAGRLVVTEETVKTHVSRVLNKLGLRDRTQAVVTAYESGLVVPRSRE
jgi:DNA-binding NarL/FixJ family response regulator